MVEAGSAESWVRRGDEVFDGAVGAGLPVVAGNQGP